MRSFGMKIDPSRPFKHESRMSLYKKRLFFGLAQSNLVINHGEKLTHQMYKILGTSFTNKVIERTVGELFTSGPTISTLIRDADSFWNQFGIGGVANYVAEGIEKDDPKLFDKVTKDMANTILQACSASRPYIHLAIKLTGMGDMEMFKRWSKTQHTLINEWF